MAGAVKTLLSFPGDRRDEAGEKDQPVITYQRLKSHKRTSLAYLFIWLILVAFGLTMMFSASYGISFVQSSAAMRSQLRQAGALDPSSPVGAILEADATALARKQAIYTIGSVIAAIGAAMIIPFQQLTRRHLKWIVYAVITGALLYTIIAGQSFNGAKRWLSIGPLTFQPSELAKVGAVFFLASYFSDRQKKRFCGRVRAGDPESRLAVPAGRRPSLLKLSVLDVVLPGLLMLVWVGLTVVQPHLSGAVILSLICLAVFFFVEMPVKVRLTGIALLLVLIIVLSLIGAVIYQSATHKSAMSFISDRFAHASRRLDTFQNRDRVSDDDRMQIEQAEIALGSGGLMGKGLGKSVQKLNWLSEAHNDFIMSVIGEELGFIGVLIVIALFITYLIAGLMIARRAASLMAMLIAAGYTIMIVIQAFLNMAVAASLIPATGISLPFFSYGGTANIFFSVAAGLVLCVSKSGTRLDRELTRILDSKAARNLGKTVSSDIEEEDDVSYAI
ncbi:MAG TPA: FtsW/RodA/SpoVE family cell cycle protein [Bacillota bacterium]|nr:FtsW/RodA/SpoVE family cell cycle protein [Bacillota bacterium]